MRYPLVHRSAASAAVLATCLAGCASNFVTRPYDPNADVGKLEGIKYYDAALVRVHYEFTAYTKADTFLGTAQDKPPACKQITQKEELAVWPDMSHPRVVQNDSSPFSTTTFGVGITNGMLTSVNMQSAPQTATLLAPFLAAAATAAFTVKSTAEAPPDKLPACNAAPVITSVTPVTSFSALSP